MRLIVGLVLLVCLPFAVAAEPTPGGKALAEAIELVRIEDWDAAATAARPAGAVGRDIVEWYRLRKGGLASFDAYRRFLVRRADWPGLDLLHTRGEGSIPVGAVPQQVIEYFHGDLPETGAGVLRLADAYLALGEERRAQSVAVRAWRSRLLTAETEAALLERFAPVLSKHHVARLNELLWRGSVADVQRNLARAPEGWRALAEARLALQARAPGVDKLVEAVPPALRNDPGLAFERFSWRAAKGLDDEAIALLAARSVSAAALGRPEQWANLRQIYARRLLREGSPAQAYSLASQHFLSGGSSFADLEWLSGFIALRHLDDPELALWHFDRLAEAVKTPISLGRAGYWRGRAFDAMGNPAAAKQAFAEGAVHQSSYYGLLAAEAAGVPMDPRFDGREAFPPLETSPLRHSSVLSAGLLLLDAGNPEQAERFLTHLSESLDRPQAGTLAELMLSAGQTHIALMIAKRVAGTGIILPAAYFPLSPVMDRKLPVSRELALSIARRESEFDPLVVSGAGARGLMQLMPSTAKQVAGELQIPFEAADLTGKPAYNVTLGTAYLAHLIELFGPAPVLVAVGYNAGPSRSIAWVRDGGDPRDEATDVIDWIEMIPFQETRNYVMRVTESLMIYRARLNGLPPSVEMTDMLRRG